MTISGNISSATYGINRAGLPASHINAGAVKIVSDDAVWPCGLILGKTTDGYLPYAEYTVQIGTGDASAKDFNFNTGGGIEPGSVSITAGGVTLTDDGCGNLTGSGGAGSVNYETGGGVVSFSTAPADAAAIDMTYKPDPCAVLDAETDTAKADSAIIVRFGAVRSSELKVGVAAPAAPAASVTGRLNIHNIYEM